MSRVGYAAAPADGLPIFYELDTPGGDQRSGGNAAAIVLCDGIGCDGYVWKYLRPTLAAGFRVVHWHYPGHGRTPAPSSTERLTIADLADDLAAVLDDLDTARAAIAGHSMGVQVALEFYRRHRARVDALLLMCGAPGYPLRTFRHSDGLERLLPAMRRAVDRAPRIARRLTRALVPTQLAYAVAARVEVNGRLLDQADFMPYLRGASRVDPALFLALLDSAGRHTADDLLGAIAVPTLVVAGERDGFTPAGRSIDMAEAIPGAELLMIRDGSHTAPLERPDLVCRAAAEFCEAALGAGPSSAP